jgi:starch phosphorylase
MSQTSSDSNANLFRALKELAARRGDPEKPAVTLTSLVELTAHHFGTEVCSIYLLEPDRTNMVLAATVGLRPEAVGNVRIGIHEGLTGKVATLGKPVAIESARTDPAYRYFAETGEGEYESFLGVPLADRGILQGVLVVQTAEPRKFSPNEVRMLSAVASEMAPIVQEIRTIAHFVAPTSEKLWELARNLWWSWDNDAGSLFRDIDPVRWAELGQNPIKLLNEIPLDELERRAGDLVLHSRVNYTYRRFREYLQSSETWGTTHAGVLGRQPVAYFSAEFGLHESVPIYSGGLGVLAGDHIKSASDLGVPLVGIGLFYSQGYFRQRLDADAWQGEEYLKVDPAELPFTPALGKNGEPVTVAIETRTGTIQAKVWSVAVGRCLLLLLDSNLEGNAPEDRELTARLYGGDTRVRIRQELLLGVGGVRALRTMGISPGLLHLNEGHSAFAVFEAIRERMVDDGLDFEGSTRRVHRRVVFTTHTPVPAGHDRFPESLVEEHLGPLRDALGRSVFDFMSLGRVNPDDPSETFCMTVLALKLSRRANAVSSLHGEVSRAMWTSLWPNRVEDAVPIGHITNGVHVLSWLAPQMFRLYRRHLGSGWHRLKGATEDWKNIEEIDDGELWETHLALKSRLLKFARRRSVRQAERRGALPAELERLSRVLSPDALTIGFARRFATYKRADLILSQVEELAELANDPHRPVQFVFAGKAHPLDEPGKRVLQKIARLTRDPRFADRIVFIEDYDIDVGRLMVQGVDLWLNTPRRPMEASGTSGQKVVMNGGLNLSVLDGWWVEAHDGHNGFSIGPDRAHMDPVLHDSRDSEDLYRILSQEVIPLYYQRDRDGLPRGWIQRVKRAIVTLGWRFNANRMVMDYTTQCYVPAAGGTSSSMGNVG